MCSYCTSSPSRLQTRLLWILPPSLSCSMLNRTSLGEVAENSFTGTLTNPKEIDPLQIGLGIRSGHLAREARRDHRRRGRGCAVALVRELLGVDAEVSEQALLVLAE